MKRTWTEKQFIAAVKESNSLIETIKKLGLNSTGNSVIKKHIKRLELDTSHWIKRNHNVRTKTKKCCSRCKKFKLFKEFYKSNNKKDGLTGYCKSCKLDYDREWSWANRYGLDREGYERMLERQDKTCAICDQSPNGGRWDSFYVDHDHKNNKIRGLLCSSCNLLLGKADDNPEILERAAAYLRSYLNATSP